jgi:hypothetical protein
MGRQVSGLFLVLVMAVALPAGAVERICSVYLESPSALQQQIQQAALVFESPEMGVAPMMMTMMVPGGSQVKMTEPVSLHVFDVGGGKTAGVLELTPATTAEMFLKSLTAASGKPLDPAVNGRYTFENGVAQERGGRLLLARTAAELDACTGGAVPALPPMPAVPGVIRVAMAPSAVVPMLDAAKAQMVRVMATGGEDSAQAKAGMKMMFDLYTRTLAQINTVNVGIGVQTEGLMIRSQLVPVSGSTLSGILATMQPVDPEHVGFVEAGTLFSMASGPYTLSDQLKRQIVSLYIRMIETTAPFADVDTTDLAFAMRESIESMGAAMAWSLAMRPNDKALQMKGVVGITPSVPYLEKMVDMANLPGMKAMMEQSGVRTSTPEKRMYKDYPVYNWAMTINEAAMLKQMGAAGQDKKAMAGINAMMALFGSGYAYAATPKGIAVGLGSPAMVEQASDQLMSTGAKATEAGRIRALLAPATDPVVIGRFGLLDAVRAAMRIGADVTGEPMPAAIAALPAGEGIVFADWLQGSDVNTAMLIPAADIKALTAMVKTMKQSAIADMSDMDDGEDRPEEK